MRKRRPPAGAGRHLGALRRRWRLIALVALLGLALAAVWSLRRTPIYEATASVLVSPVPTPSDGGAPGQLLSMRDERQVARSLPVARMVAQRFATSATPEQLLQHVSVEVPADSRILRITYADPVWSTARTGADAFAAGYLAYRREAVAAQVRSLVANLTREIAALTARKQAQEAILDPDRQATPGQRDAALALREAYGSQLAQLERQRRAVQAAPIDPGSVIQPARLQGRSEPGPLAAGGIGLAAGLLLGTAAAFVADALDRRLRGRDDLAKLLDRPVLGSIPHLAGWRRRRSDRRRRGAELVMAHQPSGPAAEAYRSLRARVRFLAGRLEVNSILVTSAGPGEGKSTVAANLALALAEAEHDVLLISADLRRPRLHQLFELPNRSGLPDLLAEGLLEDDQPVPALQARVASELWSVTKYLWVIVSRPSPPEVAALLGSEAMGRLLALERGNFDFIILDGPPALAAADTLALAPLVDAVLVVADSALTNRNAVARLRDQLEQVGARVLGAVLNRHRGSPSVYQYEG